MNRLLRMPAFLIALMLICLTAPALAFDDIDAHRSCVVCGMDRKAFGYSRMLIQYNDGSEVGVCSLHCAVIEMDANKARKVRALLVADRDTRILLGADEAFWVTGGTKRGVMTEHPAWAFSTKNAAEDFIKQYEGSLASWADVLAAAREEASKERR